MPIETYHWAPVATTTNLWNTTGIEPTRATYTTDYVTREEFEQLINKIYKVITEHIQLDITEEEFVNLIKE